VRVTTKGASVALPLRMVAVGTGATVGITLWVIGEGRYEPQNFPSFVIATDEIAWDWTKNKSDYPELRAARAAGGAGRIWEIESSIDLSSMMLSALVKQGSVTPGSAPAPTTEEESAARDYVAVTDPQSGAVITTAVDVRKEDLATLFHGLPTGTPRVTRLHGDIAHASLDADLVLTAAKDQNVLSNVRTLTKEAAAPLCPIWNGCSTDGQAPRDEAAARSKANEDENASGCSATPESPTWLGVGLFALGFVVVHRRWRRRSS